MGGGSGGYERPSDDGGSGGGSGDSGEDEPSHVPPPNSEPDEGTTEDQSDESSDTSDEGTQEDSPPTSGGGGTGAPVVGPGEGPDETPDEDDSEPGEGGPPQNDDGEEGEPESPDPPEGDNGHSDERPDGEDTIEPGPEDKPEDTESERGDQEDNQQDREERQEDREQETDDEEKEEDGDDQEEDDEDENEEDDEEDECLIAESTLLHSPKPEPLGDASEGDICSVDLREGAVCVVDSQGRIIGAVAEPWVGKLKECIKQGRQYRARILDIDGGKCEVRITNNCLLNRNVDLSAVNSTVRDQLHPGLALSVDATTEGVAVVTADGSSVGDIPNPWARLLRECINRGRSYQSEVRDVTPEYCTVNVQNSISDE